jgi:deoxyribodipyrimidine photo-lyase
MYKKSLFIFRRDLRTQDNAALYAALEQSEEVVCCFILDPRQVEEHKYRSIPAMIFMFNSLRELDGELNDKDSKLHLFYGEAETVIENILSNKEFDAVFFNKDYTPFSMKRDTAIENVCKNYSITCEQHDDILLTIPGTILKDDGNPYTVFTPFYRKAKLKHVEEPKKNLHKNYGTFSSDLVKPIFHLDELLPKERLPKKLLLEGGRKEGLKLLRELEKKTSYKKDRDFPALHKTSLLSAHHKFGTISIRETYRRACDIFGNDHQFIAELYWRDFYTHIAFHFPRVFGGNFQQKYDTLT